MIQHSFEIPNKKREVIHLPQTSGHKPRMLAGSEDHKRVIFSSGLKYNDWQMGDMVIVTTGVDGRPEGYIIDILGQEQFHFVEWSGLKPKFIEVYLMESNETIMCHPSDLLYKSV